MSIILRDVIDKEISIKKKILYFVAVYGFKVVILIAILWIFWTVRSDFVEIYSNCEPFIVHAINISNLTFENVSNVTILVP